MADSFAAGRRADADMAALTLSPDLFLVKQLAPVLHNRAAGLCGRPPWDQTDEGDRNLALLCCWDVLREGRRIAAERRAG